MGPKHVEEHLKRGLKDYSVSCLLDIADSNRTTQSKVLSAMTYLPPRARPR
jgi:hypothetical protein